MNHAQVYIVMSFKIMLHFIFHAIESWGYLIPKKSSCLSRASISYRIVYVMSRLVVINPFAELSRIQSVTKLRETHKLSMIQIQFSILSSVSFSWV